MKRSLGRYSPLTNMTVAFALMLALTACGGGGAPERQPPEAASDVTATPGPGYVALSWTDNSDDETGFKVLRSTAADSPGINAQQATELASVGPDVTAYVDHDIEPGLSYRYSVVAENDVGGAAQADAATIVSVPIGVDLLIGTNNRRFDDLNGTIFTIYFVFPESVLASNELFEITLTGPATWNDDLPLEWVIPGDYAERLLGFLFGSSNEITALDGTYQVAVTVDGTTHQASYELTTAEFSLDAPTNLVASGTAGSISASWSYPAGGRSAWVGARPAGSPTFVAQSRTTQTDHSFTGLTLDDGMYRLQVSTVNSDLTAKFPIKEEPFGRSYEIVTFGVGEYYSPLCASPGEEVTIPDEALRALVREAIEVSDGPITCEGMALLVEIDEFGAPVTSVEGLEYAPNLETLVLSGSDVEDITPLAGLTNLRSLDLNSNPVTDIGPLANLTNLTDLHLCCRGAPFDDPSVLEELTKMERMNIGGRQIDDDLLASILAAMPDLQMLWLDDNEITDGSVFTEIKDLGHLALGWNQIEDIGFIADIANLWSLELRSNPIADFTPLSEVSQLQILVMADTGLSDITFLEDFTSLFDLDLADNDISDISALVANTGIGDGDVVNIPGNPLDLEDASVMTDIQALLDRGVDLTY